MGSDRQSLDVICHCPLPSDALGWKELSGGILPVSLRMHPANTENWLLPKDATCCGCGFDIYYGRKTVWPVSSGWYREGQAAHGQEMDMGFLSRTGSCPDGCGREIVVTSPLIKEAQGLIKEAQGLLWYVPQQVVWAPEEMGLLLIAQAPCLLGGWGSSSFLRVGLVSGLFTKQIYSLILIVLIFLNYFFILDSVRVYKIK